MTLTRRWEGFADLRTQAEITIARGSRVERLSGVLLLKAPDSVRFEALSPWGQPFLLVTSTSERFTLYQVAENRAVVGPASARTTERWLGAALEPRELVGVLSGHILPMTESKTATLLPPDDLGPSLRLAGAASVQRIWLNPETAVVRQVEWSKGRSRIRIIYADGSPLGPPSSLTLRAFNRPLAVTIRYRNPQVGVGLTADLFTLTLPDHARVQQFR